MTNPEQSIPGMDLNNNYSKSAVPPQEDPEQAKKKFEKTKKELEKIKNFIIKK